MPESVLATDVYSTVREELERCLLTPATSTEFPGNSIRWWFGLVYVTYTPSSELLAVGTIPTGAEIFTFEWVGEHLPPHLFRRLREKAIGLLAGPMLA